MARPVILQSSRGYTADVARAFALTMPIDLSLIFKRYGPLPAVDGVRGQDGPWERAGQTRTVLLGDGSTMNERLTDVDPGSSFGYELTGATGPLGALVSSIDGRWEFAALPGGGSTVTWTWRIHPRNVVAVPVLLIVGLLWRGYARGALDALASTLEA